jgi:hypothetical protein
MTVVLIIDKTGTIKEASIKNYDEKTLYKKAGLKTDTDFKYQHTFEIKQNNKVYSISLFGKTTGKSNYVNKYEFPPPIDNVLFFGSCILVRNDIATNTPCELNIKLWNVLYSELFGGFEDIEKSDDSDEEDSDEDVEPSSLTKDGYLKDEFVTEDSDDSSFEEKPIKKNTTGKKSKPTKPTKPTKPNNEETYLDCESELCAEDYFK